MTSIPPSNLGPMSQPWARWHDAAVLENKRDLSDLITLFGIGGRDLSASLTLSGSQLSELIERQTTSVTSPNLSTPSFGANRVTVSRTIQLPRPSLGDRAATVALSVAPSQNNSAPSNAYVIMELDGRRFYSSYTELPFSETSTPGWGGDTLQGFCGYTARTSSGGVLTLTFSAEGFDGTPKVATLGSITAEVTFAQKI